MNCIDRVASRAKVKPNASHDLTCESSAGAAGVVGVVKHTASGGLQCKSELVTDNAACSTASHSQHIAGMSQISGAASASHTSQCEGMVADNLHIAENSKSYKVRFVYNSGVVPRQVDALLARKSKRTKYSISEVKNRTVWYSGKCVPKMVLEMYQKVMIVVLLLKMCHVQKLPVRGIQIKIRA